MLNRFFSRIIVILFLSSVLLLSFQNCSENVQYGNHPTKGKTDLNSNVDIQSTIGFKNGVAKFDLDSASDDRSTTIAFQEDEKILIAGRTKIYGRFYVAITRLTNTGLPDQSFNSTGFKIIDESVMDVTLDKVPIFLSVTKNQSIVMAGMVYNADFSTKSLFVIRLKSDGSLDESFGSSGILIIDSNSDSNYQMTGVSIFSAEGPNEENIFLFGSTGKMPDKNLFLMKLNHQGQYDTNFNSNGNLIIDVDGNHSDDLSGGIAVQSDGKILVSGSILQVDRNDSDFFTIRLTAGGSLDLTFNSSGKKIIDFGDHSDDFAKGLLITPLESNPTNTEFGHGGTQFQRILLTGYTHNSGSSNDFALVRLTSSGDLDESFNMSGKVKTDFNNNSEDIAYTSFLQSDKKIVVLGKTQREGLFSQYAIARYVTSGSLDTSFNGSGKFSFSTVEANEVGTAIVQNTVSSLQQNLFVTGFAPTSEKLKTASDFTVIQLNLNGILSN